MTRWAALLGSVRGVAACSRPLLHSAHTSAAIASATPHRLLHAAAPPCWIRPSSASYSSASPLCLFPSPSPLTSSLPPRRSFSTLSPPPLSRARSVGLNTLSDNPSAKRPRIRWGRGVGSGKGKTAGRGHKGSHARNSRGLKPWFIGGQTPLYKLFPKRGFKPPARRVLDAVNLDRLVAFIAQRRIDATQVITMKTMFDCGLLSKPPKQGVKLLARGYRTKVGGTGLLPALRLEVSDASASAKKVVEAAGGEVKLVWYNRLGLRYLLKPEKFDLPPRCEAIPPPKYRKKYTQQLAGGQPSKSRMGDVV